jgi:hypothetical protein
LIKITAKSNKFIYNADTFMKASLMNRSLLVFYFIFSISVSAESSKVICELNGEYSITFKDLKKTYLSEGIEFFKNLARQTQQSLFLLDRAKTSFAESDWSRDKVYIVQYWDLDTDNETLQSLKYSIEPSPIWIYPDAASRIELSSEGPAVTHFIDNGDQHPLFDDLLVDFYQVKNSINWFTGKGKLKVDIWLKHKDGARGKSPKVAIIAHGKCEPQKKKF